MKLVKKIEFDCGETRFSQSVTMSISKASITNDDEITITKQAASQRDDTQVIFGLTESNILKMAEAIKEYKNHK